VTDASLPSGLSSPQPVLLRSVALGAGRAKVCVPLVRPDAAGLRDAVAALPLDVLDLVELRIDHLEGIERFGTDPGVATGVVAALAALREALPDDVPVLATFRSRQEGGRHALPAEAYGDLLELLVGSGACDAVDVEMFTEPSTLARVVAGAHAAGVPVVMSSHDFAGTPPQAEIVSRLRTQQNLGADVVKIAVMPRTARDVLTLLAATEEFCSEHATRPAITMAMGPLGTASRLVGESFGSCLSFGAVGAPSAPGQVDARELRTVIDVLHTASLPR